MKIITLFLQESDPEYGQKSKKYTNKKVKKMSGWKRANYSCRYQFDQHLMQDDQLFGQKASIIVLIMFLTQNFKKIEGSNCKNFKKLNTGILIKLRNFWDSISGILKNAEPDPLPMVSYKKKGEVREYFSVFQGTLTILCQVGS